MGVIFKSKIKIVICQQCQALILIQSRYPGWPRSSKRAEGLGRYTEKGLHCKNEPWSCAWQAGIITIIVMRRWLKAAIWYIYPQWQNAWEKALAKLNSITQLHPRKSMSSLRNQTLISYVTDKDPGHYINKEHTADSIFHSYTHKDKMLRRRGLAKRDKVKVPCKKRLHAPLVNEPPAPWWQARILVTVLIRRELEPTFCYNWPLHKLWCQDSCIGWHFFFPCCHFCMQPFEIHCKTGVKA